MEYNLELDKVIKAIKSQKAKTVLIQLADGLKPKALEIVDQLERATGANVLIWLDSCFGACDVPNQKTLKDVDLIVQFGHNEFGFSRVKNL